MKGLGSLIRMHLNVNFGISVLKHKYLKQKKELWQPILFLIAMLSLVPVYMGFIYILKGMYTALQSVNQEGVLILLGILASQVLLLLFGITHIFAKFYYANDLQILIPLPIKPSTILTARFITVMVNEYLTVLPLLLPVFIIYGLGSRAGITYWLYSILIAITIPIIPLAFATILVMLLMKYTNIKGKRDLIRIIGGLLMIVIILGIQVVARNAAMKIPQGSEAAYIAQLLSNKNSLIMQMGASFPPSLWATSALTNSNSMEGLQSILIFVAVSAMIFYGMVGLSEKMFYKGLIGGQEVTAKNKRLTDQQLKGKLARVKHPIWATFERDLKILVRTPIFLMNSIGAVIIIPFAVAIPIFIGNEQQINMLRQIYNQSNIVLVNLVLAGIVIYLGANNGIGATAFSREGRQFWISRILPVPVEDQLLGKILTFLLVQVLALIVILGGLSLLVTLELSTLFIVALLSILGSIPIAEVAMMIDIARPLLDWDNPQRAMKQNLNVLFTMIFGTIYMGLLILLVYWMFGLGLKPLSIYLILGLGFAILSLGLFRILARFAGKRFREIE